MQARAARGLSQDHPQVTKVADMARAAGEAWRAISPEAKAVYEAKSAENKVDLLLPPHACHLGGRSSALRACPLLLTSPLDGIQQSGLLCCKSPKALGRFTHSALNCICSWFAPSAGAKCGGDGGFRGRRTL